MLFSLILKANPYHGKDGRFTTEAGANSVSIGPKFQNTLTKLRAAHNAANKAKGRQAAPKAKTPAPAAFAGKDADGFARYTGVQL